MHKCSEPHNGVMMPRVQNHDAAHATPRRQTPHGWVKGMPAPLAVVCLSWSPRPYTAASKQLIGWRQPPAGRPKAATWAAGRGSIITDTTM